MNYPTVYGKYGASRSGVRAFFDWLVLGGAFLVTHLPQRVDRFFIAATMATYRTVRGRKVTAVADKMGRLLGDPPDGVSWIPEAREYWRMRVETHWLRVRSMHRTLPLVEIRLDGLEHLEAALAKGKGAILWRMFFCSSHIPKQALHDAGHPLVHLSHWDHGNRGLNFPGVELFAPQWIKAEVRHLRERVILPKDGSLDYLRRLLDRLGRNQVLSIFGNLQGRTPIPVQILGTQRLLATGATSLARKTGAPMLTMYARRLGPNSYQVVIDEPVVVDPSLDRRAFAAAAITEYARRVEERVRSHPQSWYRWETYQDHR